MSASIGPRNLTPDESALLALIISKLRGDDAHALAAQIDATSVSGGIPTMLDLVVARGATQVTEGGSAPCRPHRFRLCDMCGGLAYLSTRLDAPLASALAATAVMAWIGTVVSVVTVYRYGRPYFLVPPSARSAGRTELPIGASKARRYGSRMSARLSARM